MTLFDDARRAVLDVCLPPHCVRCGAAVAAARAMVCSPCWASVQRIEAPFCARCGHPGATAECRWCALLPPWIATCRSWCWVPDGAGGDLVHALKYDGWARLGESLGARVATRRPLHPPGTRLLVVPVPVAATRRRERGYNQAALIARAVASHWGADWDPELVQRTRSSESQVRLTPAERSANVQGAFSAGPGAMHAKDRDVVVVDDVVTTAATLVACDDIVRAAGARRIHLATFGRARAAWDRSTPSWSLFA